MSLPKVTLLGAPGNTYTIAYGTGTYEFTAGVTRKVPVPIALEARKRKTRDGRPMFDISMPATILDEARAETKVRIPKKAKAASEKQTAPAAPQQTKLEL
jgi:hypothetical protein